MGLNLANSLSVQGEVFLIPLAVFGLWKLRKDRRVQIGFFAWFVTLAAMTVVFPFAGARGGFFHSGAAVQTLWWVLAPIGLDSLISWGVRVRKWDLNQAGKLFRPVLVILAVLFTASVVYLRIFGGGTGQAWDSERASYSNIASFLASRDASSDNIIMVADPPGYYLASGNPAIALPNGDVYTLLAVAGRYGASYAVLEESGMPAGLVDVYQNPQNYPMLSYLGDVDSAKIYGVQP